MHFLQWLKSLLSVNDSVLSEQFMLTPDDGDISQGSQRGNEVLSEDKGQQPTVGNRGEVSKETDARNTGLASTAQSESQSPAQNQPQGVKPQNPPGPGAEFAQKDGGNSNSGKGSEGNGTEGNGTGSDNQSAGGGERHNVKPMSLSEYLHNAEKTKEPPKPPVDTTVSDELAQQDAELDGDLDRTKAMLKAVFHIPPNADFVIREFTVGTENPWQALAIFIDGMSDKVIINEHMLAPLMMMANLVDDPKRNMDKIVKTLIPGNQVETKSAWMDIVNGIITGSTVIFIEGCKEAVIVESKGWEHRSVSTPTTEQVVRGSHDAFTEMFRANTGLIRARIRSENLITEMLSVGTVAKTDVAVMYIAGITNTKLVDEVKKRISTIDVDFLGDSGVLEQFLEDNPRSLIPQIMSTERPDRATELLMEGHVVMLIGQNPFALIAPTVLWTLVHSSEDAYLKAPFGTFVRLIRWVAMFVAILLPSLYVALTNYHSEMLPTDLMLAIAGSREQVPFPVILEVLMMEFALELIREAGIRIPSVIGPTIGIVGALIIGQAAVQAGLVSALLVIIVAVTALASFTIPNYNLSFSIRVLRFVFLLGAAFFGFYGIALLWCIMTVKLAVQKSFGVSFLSPVAPPSDTSPDVFLHLPAYTMNERPGYLYPQKRWRQDPQTRPWSPLTRRTNQTKQGRRKK